MSPEEQQATIERLKADYAKLSQELKLLKIEIESIGKTLMLIGRTLVEKPLEIYSIGDIRPDANPLFQAAQKHVDRLKELDRELPKLRDQLRSVGVHVE